MLPHKISSTAPVIKTIISVIFISLMVLGLSIYRMNINTADTIYKNSDATYHVLLTLQALDENTADTHKWLPIITLGNSLSKNAPWGDTKPDTQGNYFYFSFPQLGFLAPYLSLKLFNAEISYQNLVNFNFCVGWLAVIALFFFIRKVTVDCFSSPSVTPAILATITYATSLEFLLSQGYVYWAHSLSQVFFICFLYNLHDAITAKTNRSLLLMFLFGVLFSSTEWTGYVCLLVSLLYFLPKTLKADKFSLLAFVILGLAGILATALFVFSAMRIFASYPPTQSALGNYDYIFKFLFRHAETRSLNHPIPIINLLQGYYFSFGYYTLAIFPLAFFAFIFNSLSKKEAAKKTSTYISLFGIAFFIVVIENILMKQHAINYTYDRLKLIIPITLLIPYVWTIRSTLGHFVKIILIVLIFATAFTGISNYPKWALLKEAKISGNDLFVKNVNLEKSIIVSTKFPNSYLAVLFHKNFYDGGNLSANSLLKLADKNKAERVTMINAATVGPGFRKISDLDVYDVKNKTMIKYTKSECDKKSVFLKQSDGLFQCQYDLHDLQDDTAFNITDADWNKGIALHKSGFLVMGTEFLYTAGQRVMFNNREERTITEVVVDPPFLQVFVDGAPLDGQTVGWPHPIKGVQ